MASKPTRTAKGWPLGPVKKYKDICHSYKLTSGPVVLRRVTAAQRSGSMAIQTIPVSWCGAEPFCSAVTGASSGLVFTSGSCSRNASASVCDVLRVMLSLLGGVMDRSLLVETFRSLAVIESSLLEDAFLSLSSAAASAAAATTAAAPPSFSSPSSR
ncbi:hypothetical protein E2C01_028667 [Portunus trituberculatus]|uniref:Uncharacterized protein n=1 Tax=Portunus trituberculatus TaxID=210409 RepID=A0A5B7EPM4_PORTR|nr:hypothetical protein [Portunus trituberculatus]